MAEVINVEARNERKRGGWTIFNERAWMDSKYVLSIRLLVSKGHGWNG